MSDFVKDGKIFGIVPVEQYTKITYLLVLGASVIGLLLTVLTLAGINTGLGGIVMIAGLIGLAKAVLGLFVFKDVFSELDQNHFMYIIVLWVALFIAGMILGAVFGGGLLAMLVMIIMSVIQTVLFYTGYNSWSRGRMIDKDNIKSEIQLALKRS